MKLKLDEAGHVIVENGMPVYEHEDGSAKPHDAAKTMATLKRFGEGEKSWRERATKAEAAVANFAGIDDPEAARNALQTVASMDGKHKLDLERVRGETAKQFQARLDAAEANAKATEDRLHSELIGGGFARSKFIADKLAIPADVAQAFFGSAFVIENGQMVAKGKDGLPILSKTTGQPASFDEAIEVLVGGYERKDSILRADQKAGTGAKPGTQGNSGNKQMTVEAFDKLSPKDQAARMQDGFVLIE